MSSCEIAALIYSIGRDNEAEMLSEELQTFPQKLLFIAQKSIDTADTDAQWQFAEQLGNLKNHFEVAEKLLVCYFHRNDEYLSRRALLSLSRLGSSQIEKLIAEAWQTNNEYQRIAVLHSLNNANSSKLSEYLKLGYLDGREYLVQNANELSES